jgi:hypothetical protein
MIRLGRAAVLLVDAQPDRTIHDEDEAEFMNSPG